MNSIFQLSSTQGLAFDFLKKKEIMEYMFQESHPCVIFHVKDEILDTRITIYYSTREGRRRLRLPLDLSNIFYK